LPDLRQEKRSALADLLLEHDHSLIANYECQEALKSASRTNEKNKTKQKKQVLAAYTTDLKRSNQRCDLLMIAFYARNPVIFGEHQLHEILTRFLFYKSGNLLQ
jgi:hypothetical protein